MQYNKVEISGVNTNELKTLKESEKLELLKKAKENGIHTAIETCGYAEKSKILEIAKYVDLFLFDCKELYMNYSFLPEEYFPFGEKSSLSYDFFY